jgi:parallel beta-helix repeat protein
LFPVNLTFLIKLFSDEDAGIDIRSENNLIRNVKFTGNNNYGIYLYQAHNNTIENCFFKDNINGGIYSLYSNDNLFNDNTFINNTRGLHLRYVYDSIVTNNSISSSEVMGIYLYASRRDVINDNVFTENNLGIHIKGAKNNTLKGNLFMGNVEGIYFCCGGEENKIFLNSFITNDIHAYGNPINEFDNGSVGNYWDDYNGIDADGDGIGDTFYNVTTSSYSQNNIDRFPLMSPS